MVIFLNGLSEKFDTPCAELSIEATNQDTNQEYEHFIEDNMLVLVVIDCKSELVRLKSIVKELMVFPQVCKWYLYSAKE